MTHADMIRGMSDEELLNSLIAIKASYAAELNDEKPTLPTTSVGWAAWLKEETK